MKITLEKVREKYPNANYSPDSECQKCKGKGEWYCDRKGQFVKAGMRPCICIFVEHDFALKAAELLSETSRKILQEILGKNSSRSLP